MAMLWLLFTGGAAAQTPQSGHVTIFGDYLPDKSRTAELRARVFAEEVIDPTPRWILTLSGFAEGLLARRGIENRFPADGRKAVRDAIVRVQDASVEYKADRVDLIAGFTRVVWGRLDEIQPTDVVNPLDVSRFFFEGRSAARMPVGLFRARAFFSRDLFVEALYVAFFRRGRFDELDEPTSPFNLQNTVAQDAGACLAVGCPALLPVRIEQREPSKTFGNAQGGARVSATTGRVDWTISAYRGFEPFGFGALAPPTPQASIATVNLVYPRFTMIGGDFETVRGSWGVRGEVAAVVDDNFQHPSLRVVGGRSIDAGVGVDRKAGDYRVSATLLLHRESYDEAIVRDRGRSDVSLVVSSDRSFARARYQARIFGVYNPSETSGFLRGIATATLRDNVALEGSIGWFAGEGRDLVGRLRDSDFGYVRLKCFF
jgi:hypothetical protein